MKTLVRITIIGAIIWIIGVSLYSLSYSISILENAELQANLILFLAVIPLVWVGAKAYYKNTNNLNGIQLGLTFFLMAALLDAAITVPLLIIPNGGSYKQFFTDISFWLIGLEFIITTTIYWYSNISTKRKHQVIKK